MITTYPIHEMFFTFQGEGNASGLPAFFVRTYGCPIKCSFCDAAGTWHPSWIPKDIFRKTPEEIVSAAKASGAKRIIVTGGEPTIFDLEPLVALGQRENMEMHLETSGAFPIKGDFDWIVLSPKRAKGPEKQSVGLADEFKFIIEASEDIGYFTKLLLDTGSFRVDDARPIWLHPEWSHSQDPDVLRAIVNQVKTGTDHYRAGWQLHKLYRADSFDQRSLPLAPLGGNIMRGY